MKPLQGSTAPFHPRFCQKGPSNAKREAKSYQTFMDTLNSVVLLK